MRQATCHPERPHVAKGLCNACSNRAWQAANKEKATLQSRAWYAAMVAAHPDYFHAQYAARKEYHRVRYAANKVEIAIQNKANKLANRERRAETNRAWQAANPEKRRATARLYRARKLGAIGAITVDQWASIKAAYAWRCAYCGKKPASLTQDHVIPLSLGGSHIPANIVPACRSCNSSKGTRPPTRLPALRLLI